MIQYLAYLNVFLPLISAILIGFLCKVFSKSLANILSCLFMLIATISATFIFIEFTDPFSTNDILSANKKVSFLLFEWFLKVNFTITIDKLSAIMMFVVTSVSFLVHCYSVSYMEDERDSSRFMSYLSLFTFFMLILIISDNFLQLFLGWEGVGLSSYLLIGFWFHKPQANSAAMKAFIVNRVSDVFMAIGITIVFYSFGSFNFSTIFSNCYELQSLIATKSAKININADNLFLLELGCFSLFIGCMGKSAQLFLHVWLPDAMEGPTPVSALIHAATMVTAGIFLLARCSPLFQLFPAVSIFIMLVGSITALFAATIAMTQFDIKKIIAYSTCSQLGYMFAACGVSAYDAAIFHLFTHAFFKALLFLGAGSVIHALHGEQDIRAMGGLRNKIPVTYCLMLIGTLAICGIYPFAGFYSKDLILEALYHQSIIHHSSVSATSGLSSLISSISIAEYAFFNYCICLFTVGLTSFYSWRLLIMTFHGTSSNEKNHVDNIQNQLCAKNNEHIDFQPHESSLIMLIPMMLLAIGAVFSGFIGIKMGFANKDWWSLVLSLPQIPESHSVISQDLFTLFIQFLPLIISIISIVFAHIIYNYYKNFPQCFQKKFKLLYKLVYNKYYFDEIYDFLIVKNTHFIAKFLYKMVDIKLIDAIPNTIALLSNLIACVQSRMHTGKIYHYTWIMFAALMLIIYYGIIITTNEMIFMQINGN